MTQDISPRQNQSSLHRIQNIESIIPDKSAPLFVYCLSGARSRQAVSYLTASGYTQVTDIGAFSNYQGKAEKVI